MPATRSEFVSKEDFKSLKGIPVEVTSRDDDIDLLLDGAVDELIRRTGKPLVDTYKTYTKQPAEEGFLVIHGYRVKEVVELRYWVPGSSLSFPPGVYMAADTFGRLAGDLSDEIRLLYPPPSGWPESEGNLYQITTRHSMDAEGLDRTSVASLKVDAIELAWAGFSDVKGTNFDRYIEQRIGAHQSYAA